MLALYREREGERTTRWTTEPEAAVFTRLRPGAYRLFIVAEPFAWPGGPQQTVEVRIDTALIGTVALPSGFSRQQLDLPEESPGDGRRRSARAACAIDLHTGAARYWSEAS